MKCQNNIDVLFQDCCCWTPSEGKERFWWDDAGAKEEGLMALLLPSLDWAMEGKIRLC